MSGMNYRCFSPRPRSWHPADEEWGTGALSFVLSFLSRVSLFFLSFTCFFVLSFLSRVSLFFLFFHVFLCSFFSCVPLFFLLGLGGG